MNATWQARILKHSEAVTESGCWIWMGMMGVRGYGRVYEGGGRAAPHFTSAHRLSYRAFRGDIPQGLVLDHLCRVRCCVNPWHLEAVTDRVNIMRGVGVAPQHAAKLVCKYGHPFDRTEVVRGRVRRVCWTCARACKQRWNRKRPTKARLMLAVHGVEVLET